MSFGAGFGGFMQGMAPVLKNMMIGQMLGGGQQQPEQPVQLAGPVDPNATQAYPMPPPQQQGGGLDLKSMMTMIPNLFGSMFGGMK